MTNNPELCEWCLEREGVTNSIFIKDDDFDEGIWICNECELEAEEETIQYGYWLYGVEGES